MILVLCGVAAELRDFARTGVEVIAVGVGPVEAAIGTARALAARPYQLAINAGIGGAFAGRATVGEAVCIHSEQYVELGREDRGALSLPGGVRLEACAASDPGLLAQAPLGPRNGWAPSGSGVTSATITTTAERAATLAAQFAPTVESMEGFAVLRAAAAAGIAAIELRGISNIVGDRATSQWDFRAGSAAAVRALGAFLDVVKVNA